MPNKPEPAQCSKQIDGPPLHKGSPIIQWRRRCKNTTTHDSGRCHLHRSTRSGRAESIARRTT